ncbi:MAG TPA: glycosyltransferase family 2 protein [Chitinophagaceae bacterium]
MNDPKVYIVILNYKQWEDSRDCLNSVLHSAYTNFSVLLVDNNSGNDSLGHLAEWLKNNTISVKHLLLAKGGIDAPLLFSDFPKVVFFQNNKNEGFAAGNNLVLRFLQEENAYVWLLNPDMIVKENTLGELVSFAERQSPGSIIGAEVRSYSGNQGLFFYGGGKVNFISATVTLIKGPAKASGLDYISGGCLFMHAGNFKRLGLLPEEYFLYWEETDWCYKAKQQNYKLLVCPTAICYDKISTVIGKGFMSDYYYARNGLLFISKYRKKNIPVVILFMGIRILKRLVTGQWARAKGVYKGARDFLKMKPHET